MRRLAVFAACSLFAVPALALDMPTRKAGLWELKMEFAGGNLPAQTMKHCTDAATDKLMNMNFGGSNEQACSQQDMKTVGATITIDSVCKFGEAITTSHAVVTGDFHSAYTVEVTSQREASANGKRIYGQSHMTITAKWVGACAAGQKPGDVIMGNGMTMNVLDMQKMRPPAKQ